MAFEEMLLKAVSTHEPITLIGLDLPLGIQSIIPSPNRLVVPNRILYEYLGRIEDRFEYQVLDWSSTLIAGVDSEPVRYRVVELVLKGNKHTALS